MTENVKELGQITDDIINSWAEQYEQRGDGYYCRACGSRVQQTTCYVSLHLKEFEPLCTGPGKVVPINYPYCPTCDGPIDFARACFHISIVDTRPALLVEGRPSDG